MKPFFTIIIPTLNEEKYLPQLLTALGEQTYKNFEVFVVDGNSQDETAAVVIKTKKNVGFPLSLLRTQKRNVSWQRNLGTQKAVGEYIVFFDADVTVKKTYLEELLQLLQKRPVDYASTRFVPKAGNMLDKLTVIGANLCFQVLLSFGKPFMTGQNLIFKRSVFVKLGGFDETVVHAEDIDLVQRAHTKKFKGTIFSQLTHEFAIRRFNREGRLTLAWKYVLAALHILFLGPIHTPLFEYKMGGKD